MTELIVRVVALPAMTTVMPGVKSAVLLSPVTMADVVKVVPVREGASVPTTELMVSESLALSVRTTNSFVAAVVLLFVTLMVPPLMVPTDPPPDFSKPKLVRVRVPLCGKPTPLPSSFSVLSVIAACAAGVLVSLTCVLAVMVSAVVNPLSEP